MDAALAVPPEGAVWTTGQVARYLKVNPRTVRTWDGLLKDAISRTFGGHRRYDARKVVTASAALQTPGPVSAMDGMRAGPGPMTSSPHPRARAQEAS